MREAGITLIQLSLDKHFLLIKISWIFIIPIIPNNIP